MNLDTLDSPTPTSAAAWLPRFVVLLLIGLALAALVALALTFGHPLAAGHVISSMPSQHLLGVHPDSGCPAIIIEC